MQMSGIQSINYNYVFLLFLNNPLVVILIGICSQVVLKRECARGTVVWQCSVNFQRDNTFLILAYIRVPPMCLLLGPVTGT